MNTTTTHQLKGKTLFITGSTRGIGRSIALRAAQDGANVVITGKTTTPHPKLPGTIFETAKEVEARGGKALPLEMDIRDEEQIQKAVQKAHEHFGSIDILVNNASAISLTDVAHTPPKKMDLMWQINMRGTYLCSMFCYPFLKQSGNPHILNLSPPLNLQPFWFKNHTAYTISKYGMSLCVLGMAEEFRKDHIKVNALWPATIIKTAALQIIGPTELGMAARTPEIVADAAYEIFLKKDDSFTGQFLIDEEVLTAAGISDFQKYAVSPHIPPLKDYFLGEPDQRLLQFTRPQ